jgi:hypothetical protein
MNPVPRSTRTFRLLRGRGWLAALLLGPLLFTPPAAAQVYRCGSSYQDQPCAGASVVEVDDARGARQQQDAHEVARREQRLAQRLAAERLARERALRPQPRAVGIDRPRAASAPEASSTNPCQRPPGASRRAAKPRCVNGLPVYQAAGTPAPSGGTLRQAP